MYIYLPWHSSEGWRWVVEMGWGCVVGECGMGGMGSVVWHRWRFFGFRVGCGCGFRFRFAQFHLSYSTRMWDVCIRICDWVPWLLPL